MSYSSRVYRQRNPKTQEDSKDKPFFSKEKQQDAKGKKGTFFQAKGKIVKPGDHFEKEADSVANRVVNQPAGKAGVQKKEITPVQRLATTPEEEKVSSNDERMERDKEKPFQTKSEEPEKEKQKPVQKMDDPDKKKEPIQKMDDPEKKKEPVQKMDDPEKKKEPVQKMDDPKKDKDQKVQKMDDKKEKDQKVQKMDAGKEKDKKPEKS